MNVKYKNLLWIAIILFLIPILQPKALKIKKECSNEQLEEYKALANLVEINYEYLDSDNDAIDWGNTVPEWTEFTINITGITDKIYVANTSEDTIFRYSDTTEGSANFFADSDVTEIKFEIYPTDCSSKPLRKITLSLPVLNEYYYSKECEKLEKYNLKVCQKLIPNDFIITEATFNAAVNKYLEEEQEEISILDKIKLFLKNPYVLGIGGTLILSLIIVIIVIKRKRSELN